MESDEIFEAYLNDRCPACSCHVNEDLGIERVHGGKLQSLEFECQECNTRYVVGMGRGVDPFYSEILSDNSRITHGE